MKKLDVLQTMRALADIRAFLPLLLMLAAGGCDKPVDRCESECLVGISYDGLVGDGRPAVDVPCTGPAGDVGRMAGPRPLPFVHYGEDCELLVDVHTQLSTLRFGKTGREFRFGRRGVPLFVEGEFAVFRDFPDNNLFLCRCSGSQIKYHPMTRKGVDYLLFRGGLSASSNVFVVVYDNDTRKNYLRQYGVHPDGDVRDDGFAEYELPSFHPPAGHTYEMEPPVVLLRDGDGVRILAGDANVAFHAGRLQASRVENCTRVLEAVPVDGSLGYAVLGESRTDPGRYFIVSNEGVRDDLPCSSGVPYNLKADSGNVRMDFARDMRGYADLLFFDIERNHSGGVMDFGSNNIEGRVAWSQIYYLNGLLDIMDIADRSTVGRKVFGDRLGDVECRLRMEVRMLASVLKSPLGYSAKCFTVNRVPAVFAVQTSRLLMLFDRYFRRYPEDRRIFDLEALRESVASLDGHIEVLDNKVEYEGLEGGGRNHYLMWPKGCAFYFDGLGVPYNRQNEWAASLFSYAASHGIETSEWLKRPREIIAFYIEHLMADGEFPAVGKWHYWWGRAMRGYSADSGYSVNTPSYRGDHSLAWISFRTIDVVGVLSSLPYMAGVDDAPIVKSALERVREGALYPFVVRLLLERGEAPLLSRRYCHEYARSGAPCDIANQPWVLWALCSADNWSHDIGEGKMASIYEAIMHQSPIDNPAIGKTDYPGNAVEVVPKAQAMLLKAELLRARAGALGELPNRADVLAMQLMRSSDLRKDGFPGWGVPADWDAYGDGSVNPRHTKYTISSAIVIDALLDWAETQTSDVREKILDLAVDVCKPYFKRQNLSPSGMMPYSLEPSDIPYETFNPAVYMAGVMQRLSGLVKDRPSVCSQLQDVADKTMAVAAGHRQRRGSGSVYWHYSISEPVPNDLPHAAYIVYGINEYAKHGGRVEFDLPSVGKHFGDFLSDESGLKAFPFTKTEMNRPRSYDVGMALYALSKCAVDRSISEGLRRALLSSIYEYYCAGHVSRRPVVVEKPLFVREYECYIMLGIAASIWGRDGRSFAD